VGRAEALTRLSSQPHTLHTPHRPASSDDGAELFAASERMQEVVGKVARAASARSGVLISGERGTGRHCVARAIHARRISDPRLFVRVDCGAFDAGELETQLFGTTSSAANQGLESIKEVSLLGRARGGTVYFQNLVDASARVQSRLSRILRDREAVIVESGETAPLDVRPIAGVDPAIEDSVREGRLREDLYRRFSGVQIEVPPLRNRRDDIPALAEYFVTAICERLHLPPKSLSNSARMLITALPWRGNATELRGLLETVVPTCDGRAGVGIEDILAHLKLDGGAVEFVGGGTLRQARARFEREYIANVLEQHHGRISEAARAMGIQRTNLYRKMRALHVGRIKKDTKAIGS